VTDRRRDMLAKILLVLAVSLSAGVAAFLLAAAWWMLTLTDYSFGRTVGGFALVVAVIVGAVTATIVLVDWE
jgi:hypothetical protein